MLWLEHYCVTCIWVEVNIENTLLQSSVKTLVLKHTKHEKSFEADVSPVTKKHKNIYL